jgi:hypothetical protein
LDLPCGALSLNLQNNTGVAPYRTGLESGFKDEAFRTFAGCDIHHSLQSVISSSYKTLHAAPCVSLEPGSGDHNAYIQYALSPRRLDPRHTGLVTFANFDAVLGTKPDLGFFPERRTAPFVPLQKNGRPFTATPRVTNVVLEAWDADEGAAPRAASGGIRKEGGQCLPLKDESARNVGDKWLYKGDLKRELGGP